LRNKDKGAEEREKGAERYRSNEVVRLAEGDGEKANIEEITQPPPLPTCEVPIFTI